MTDQPDGLSTGPTRFPVLGKFRFRNDTGESYQGRIAGGSWTPLPPLGEMEVGIMPDTEEVIMQLKNDLTPPTIWECTWSKSPEAPPAVGIDWTYAQTPQSNAWQNIIQAIDQAGNPVPGSSNTFHTI